MAWLHYGVTGDFYTPYTFLFLIDLELLRTSSLLLFKLDP